MACRLGLDKKVSEYRRIFTLKYVVGNGLHARDCIIACFCVMG